MKKEEQFFSENLQEDLENLERYIEEYSLFLPLAVYSVNPVGIIVDVNQTGKELSKYQEIELIGQDIEIIFKNPKKIKKFFNQTLKKGSIKNREMILVTKNKKEIPVRASASIRQDQEGNIIGCFIALNDITEIKKFQTKLEDKVKQRTEELEKTKNKLAKTLEETKEAKRKVEGEKNKTSAIISNLVDPIIIIDQEDKINLYNPKAKEIFGFTKSSIGKKVKKKDKILKLLIFELLFSNPQNREYSEGLTAIELSRRFNCKIDIIKKNLKLLQEKRIARSTGISPKFWLLDDYNFQRLDENDPINLLVGDVEDIDFESFFEYSCS